MQMLNSIKNNKYIKLLLLIIAIPFLLVVINLLLNTIFNLGIYVGTFLRFMYNIVVF